MNILFYPINSTILFISAAILIVAIFITFFLLTWKHKSVNKKDKFEDLFLKIREEIKSSVTPKFINVSIEVNEITDLAVEIWRIEQRITKSRSSLSDQQLNGFDNSVQKLKRYLAKYDIEIVDYKDQKYNNGLNIDVLSVEKDFSLAEPKIKETVEPAIMCKGQVVRKAKVILINNN